MATATNDKPVKIGQLPIIKENILANAREMDKGIAGGYSGTFPLSSATKDGIYLLPSTGKFYVCETAYNGNQISAPNSNFVELSVWKNHDRLTNLTEVWQSSDKTKGYIKHSNGLLEQWGVINDSTNLTENIQLQIPYVNENYSISITNNNDAKLWYTNKEKKSFIVTCSSSSKFQKNWYAIGFWK